MVAYAFSPFDLIPDFIPVLGYLDDLVLVPLGIFLVLRLIPEHVRAHARVQAENWMRADKAKPINYLGAVLVVLLWLGLSGIIISIILETWK